MTEPKRKPTNRVVRKDDKDIVPRIDRGKEKKGTPPSEMSEMGRAISSVNTGKEASHALEFIGSHIYEQSAKIDAGVFAELARNGKLEPEFAVQMWIQKFSLSTMVETLSQKKKTGESAAKQAAKFLVDKQ